VKELILNFHGIGVPHFEGNLEEKRYWLGEDAFLVALDDIAKSASELSLSILITFDDGNASDASIALPALLDRGLKAKFFVCAGRVGLNGYLDREAMRELLSCGMSIGTHGMWHVPWRGLRGAQLESEVIGSKTILERLCGREITEASIPFGSYDRLVLTKLRSAGFQRVYNSNGGLTRSDSWLKPRNTIDASSSGRAIVRDLIKGETVNKQVRRLIAASYKRLR
jgi:peptidoglycan/xylan/chitin deacetylase (PgdA/CDA1 family)